LSASLWPLQIIEATLRQVTIAKIDDANRAKILHQNAWRLLAKADRATNCTNEHE
jgi:predicted TIM-barrel fold metal-dependent hydrolase